MERQAAPRRRVLALAAGLAVLLVLLALGGWQLQRLQWKRALIEQVARQQAAAPQAAPGPALWAGIGAADAYRRISVRGRFDHRLEACTQALSPRGAGCWVLTPLQTEAGWWLLVNRGFVSPGQRNPATRPQGQVAGDVTVTGLLRLSEPGGGFLRRNDPAQDRWTSRDVAAIAAARGLDAGAVAPYFLDASQSLPGGPEGGLTVLRFRNHHAVYALTWFSLAGLAAWGLLRLWRER